MSDKISEAEVEVAATVFETDKALVAILEGYPASFADGYITVENPDATPERIALGGVNPNLVIDIQALRHVVAARVRHEQQAAVPAGAEWRMVPVEPTDEMIDAGLASTSAYLDIQGSALTVNREKMRRRYIAMINAAARVRHEQQAGLTEYERRVVDKATVEPWKISNNDIDVLLAIIDRLAKAQEG
jgi:hypothetical protein